jgi:hypothetical protein
VDEYPVSLEKKNPNIWSLQYCSDVFGMMVDAADTWEKSELRIFILKLIQPWA